MEFKTIYAVVPINDFSELKEYSFSGGLDTLETIIENNKEHEIMNLIHERYLKEDTPNFSDLNDWLWFERDEIFINLNMAHEI